MQRCRRILLSFLAGSFFSSPVISSFQAADFDPVGRNRRIKIRRKAGVAAAPRRLAAAILAALFPAWPLPAQTTWTGLVSSNWFNGPNWFPFAVPTSATDAIIETTTLNPTVVGFHVPGAVALNLSVGQDGPGMLTIESGGW